MFHSQVMAEADKHSTDTGNLQIKTMADDSGSDDTVLIKTLHVHKNINTRNKAKAENEFMLKRKLFLYFNHILPRTIKSNINIDLSCSLTVNHVYTFKCWSQGHC